MTLEERLDRLRRARGWNWIELGRNLGLSRTMIYNVRKGHQPMGIKSEHRLREAEVDSGLSTPAEAQDERLELLARTPVKEKGKFLSEASEWNLAEMTQKLPMLPEEKQDEITGEAVSATNRALSKHFALEAERPRY